MKKHHPLLVLMAGSLLVACSLFPPTQAAPTVGPIVLPTELPPTIEPTALPTTPETVPSDTPVPTGGLIYFWPISFPEGFSLVAENSRADSNGFVLEFMDSNQGIVLHLSGGAEADLYEYCKDLENNPSTPVTVRGQEGCYPPSMGGGFAVEWKENGTHYIVGGMGVSKELALTTAEQLEALEMPAFLEHLTQAGN